MSTTMARLGKQLSGIEARLAALPPDRLEAALAAVVERYRAKKAAKNVSLSRPQSDDELWSLVRDLFGFSIPRRAVCPGHTAPFRFLADAYFHRFDNAVVLANRGGGKTLLLAILHALNSLTKPGFSTTHYGAIDLQARRAYNHLRNFIQAERLKPFVAETLKSHTSFVNRSTVEVLPATEKQTQGPHAALVTYDELESGEYAGYELAKAQPVEWTDVTGERYLGQFIVTSTRIDAGGLMQKALDDAEASGTPIYAWCVLECMAPCGSECDADSCIWFRETEGRSAKADGWRSHADLASHRRRVSAETWEAQYLCRKPESGALVYPVEPLVDPQAEFESGKGLLYAGADYGFTDDAVWLLGQVRGGKLVLFDEIVVNRTSERDFVRLLAEKVVSLPGYDGPSLTEWRKVWSDWSLWGSVRWPDVWPILAIDPSAAQLIAEARNAGFSVLSRRRVTHRVTSGQDAVRAAMQNKAIVVNPRLKRLLQARANYRTKALPDGSFSSLPDPSADNHRWSHPLDALRYLVWGLRGELNVAGDTFEGEEDD